MTLASCPARQGQQRSLRRICQFLSWAFAFSPGARSFAWAEWTQGDGEPGFRLACERLGPGPAVLRDYVKSMKHYWHEAAYIPDLADAASAWKVAARFRELREDEFARGFVLRRFERFTSAEVTAGGPAAPAGSSQRTPTRPVTCRRTSTCLRSRRDSGPLHCRS
jgi:hypothetical protein